MFIFSHELLSEKMAREGNTGSILAFIGSQFTILVQLLLDGELFYSIKK